jgi:hypothetical protein
MVMPAETRTAKSIQISLGELRYDLAVLSQVVDAHTATAKDLYIHHVAVVVDG